MKLPTEREIESMRPPSSDRDAAKAYHQRVRKQLPLSLASSNDEVVQIRRLWAAAAPDWVRDRLGGPGDFIAS
jgi:hypothetical protein